ncbi:MAG: cupin domain-containing protein [Sphaerotilus sp.]|nr:cupin domain-containing protein [Sphaerotilus sp.]
MRQHWQRTPLLVRQALPGVQPPLTRADLFKLAESEAVESRLVTRRGRGADEIWHLERGPLARRRLPALKQPDWTVLVQGLDLHLPNAQALLAQFRFIPQARLDDLMISWAAEGGGVGPHFDSYDVFLIQVQGQRRWRIGRMADARIRPDLPVKIIENFQPEQEWVLSPGDMLYLPPGWAHDGDAVGGECMTCSVGFRSPLRSELARETLLRLADAVEDEGDEGVRPVVYVDPDQPATTEPGRIPGALVRFAADGLRRVLEEHGALERALGEYLSEPKPTVEFAFGDPLPQGCGVVLDARSCMLYDDEHVFMNGDSWHAAGEDAQLLRRLADARRLEPGAMTSASSAVLRLLEQWCDDGWVHPLASRE